VSGELAGPPKPDATAAGTGVSFEETDGISAPFESLQKNHMKFTDARRTDENLISARKSPHGRGLSVWDEI
jgi:hypothetical protein